MKKLIWFLTIVMLFGCNKSNDKVDLETIEYWDQETIDKYRSELEKTKVLIRDVYISREVTDLSPFRNIEIIEGELRIQWSPLIRLEDFLNLKTVSGLKIDASSFLEKIEFKNLEKIDKDLEILYNKELKRISFPKLKQVEDIGIYDNDKLEEVILPDIEEFKGVYILRNSNFSNLSGFENVQSSNFYRCQLEFREMKPSPDLFKSSTDRSMFEIKIEERGGDYAWFENLKQGVTVRIEGDFLIEDICSLKGAVDPLNPGKILLINKNTGDRQNGEILLNECM